MQFFYLYFYLDIHVQNILIKNTDVEMINIAELCREQFTKQNISRVDLHCDYYLCLYNDTSYYLVTCDGRIIRDLNHQSKIISSNAKKDTCLSERLQALLKMTEYIYEHRINSISVKADSIRLRCYDGYYITNITPYSDSKFRKIEEWYINDTE